MVARTVLHINHAANVITFYEDVLRPEVAMHKYRRMKLIQFPMVVQQLQASSDLLCRDIPERSCLIQLSLPFIRHKHYFSKGCLLAFSVRLEVAEAIYFHAMQQAEYLSDLVNGFVHVAVRSLFEKHIKRFAWYLFFDTECDGNIIICCLLN